MLRSCLLHQPVPRCNTNICNASMAFMQDDSQCLLASKQPCGSSASKHKVQLHTCPVRGICADAQPVGPATASGQASSAAAAIAPSAAAAIALGRHAMQTHGLAQHNVQQCMPNELVIPAFLLDRYCEIIPHMSAWQGY